MATTTTVPGAVKLGAEAAPIDWPRLRFAIALAIYGGAFGVAITFINFLTQYEYFEVPERLSIGQAFLFGSAGATAGALLCGPCSYWMYGVRPTFSSKGREPRRLPVWIILGLLFGFFFPLIMGGIFLPFSQYFMLFFTSIYSVPDLLVKIADLFSASWYSLAIINGFKLILTGLVAGVIFGPGAWVVDRFNTSADLTTSKYGTWVVATVLAILIVAFVQFGPTGLLVKLG